MMRRRRFLKTIALGVSLAVAAPATLAATPIPKQGPRTLGEIADWLNETKYLGRTNWIFEGGASTDGMTRYVSWGLRDPKDTRVVALRQLYNVLPRTERTAA